MDKVVECLLRQAHDPRQDSTLQPDRYERQDIGRPC
jgi:hypothetical protein